MNAIIIEACAKAAHDFNKTYCESLGDFSQKPWADMTPAHQASLRTGAREAILSPHRTPEASHSGWMEIKLSEGWAWGETKDPEAKLHPLLVDYSDLPSEHRTKNDNFLRVVRETYAALIDAQDALD